MRKRRYDSVYVPAIPPRTNWLSALWRWLFGRREPEGVRRPSAPPLPPQGEFANDTPPHVWYARSRATEAQHLFGFYKRGEPTSRRYCMRHGMTAGGWLRARKTLIRAGIVSAYDGRLLYAKRDAELRLNVYLEEVERKCRESGRYVAP